MEIKEKMQERGKCKRRISHQNITMTTSLSPQGENQLTISVSMDGVPWELDGESIHIMDIKTKESFSH